MDNKHEKIAIFGGTFDPPHKAHLAIAEAAINKQLVDKVLFIPSAIPPHKATRAITPFEHRFNMLNILLANCSDFIISDIEYQLMPTPSYTLATVQLLKQRHPTKNFYLLIGGDSLMQLHTWYKSKELVESCDLIVYPRPDSIISQSELEKNWNPTTVKGFLANTIEVPQIDLSSTEIRKKLKNNEKIANVLDKKVINYIIEHNLYHND